MVEPIVLKESVPDFIFDSRLLMSPGDFVFNMISRWVYDYLKVSYSDDSIRLIMSMVCSELKKVIVKKDCYYLDLTKIVTEVMHPELSEFEFPNTIIFIHFFV